MSNLPLEEGDFCGPPCKRKQRFSLPSPQIKAWGGCFEAELAQIQRQHPSCRNSRLCQRPADIRGSRGRQKSHVLRADVCASLVFFDRPALSFHPQSKIGELHDCQRVSQPLDKASFALKAHADLRHCIEMELQETRSSRLSSTPSSPADACLISSLKFPLLEILSPFSALSSCLYLSLQLEHFS